MKAIIIIIGVFFGIGFGMYKGIDKQKPFYWKIIAILSMFVLIVLTFTPPIAASLSISKYLASAISGYSGNIKVWTKTYKPIFNSNGDNSWEVIIADNNQSAKLRVYEQNLPEEFKSGNLLVLNAKYMPLEDYFTYNRTVKVNPLLVLPVVPGLEEQIRIMNFHVPVAWISVLAYLFAMIYSIGFLKTKDIKYDLKASASAEIGTMFCILATVTGMVWAKLNWGSFWNWDPRETSIFILLLIYGAYFALRAALDDEVARAKLSSVYSIIAFITVPFLIFVLPRIVEGLHPGSENDVTAGPVLSKKENTLNFVQQISFSLGFAAFSLVYFWLLNLRYRIKKIDYDIY